jgi:transmembrane 9 superfamily protein 2/4
MTGFYVFINAIIFWITRVSFGGLTGAVLYVGYSALIGFLVFILTGKILSMNQPGLFGGL